MGPAGTGEPANVDASELQAPEIALLGNCKTVLWHEEAGGCGLWAGGVSVGMQAGRQLVPNKKPSLDVKLFIGCENSTLCQQGAGIH